MSDEQDKISNDDTVNTNDESESIEVQNDSFNDNSSQQQSNSNITNEDNEKLAQLFGKSDIYSCRILIFGDIKTFDFLTIEHDESGKILAQVINITRDDDKLIGDVKIIGFKENGVLKQIRTPFSNTAEILIAHDKEIEEIVGIYKDETSCLGILDFHPDLKVAIDLKKTITKHIAVLAKSGAGKSYTVGVILEEILQKKIPIVILDPHNEYSTLKFPNTNTKDIERLKRFEMQPKGFMNQIKEFSPDTKINTQCQPITLDLNKMKPQDLVDSLPQKISPAQQSLVYNMLQASNNKVNFDELIFNLSNEESNSKWSLIALIEQLKQLRLYSTNPTPLNTIVRQAQASIISLKGVEPYVQETFVAGLLKDLFEARKREEIPPFFLVLEEAHNFCVTKDTEILTSEGYKSIEKLTDEMIVSFDHEKEVFEMEKIKKVHEKRKAEIIKLETSSGNTIKCTKDHPIWDKNEYLSAEFAQNLSIPYIENKSMRKKDIEARLFGALYSDGWVSKNKQVGFSGKYEDMIEIKKDLEFLGIKSSSVSTFSNKKSSQINTAKGVVSVSGKGSSISCSVEAYNYFKKLGSIEGEKVIQKTIIPSWIKNGSKSVKAEFLAGLMGGDGLRLKSFGKNFYVIRLYFTKLKKIKEFGDEYANTLISMFKELGVVAKLSYRKGNIRKKDGEESLKFIITISNKDDNLISFIENVGYSYNKEKEILAKKALYYLKSKKNIIHKSKKLRKEAMKLKEEKGWGKVKIANWLSLPQTLIAKWIYDGKNYSNSAGLSKDIFSDYVVWEEEFCDENFIYDQILTQEDLGVDWVYNITTGNENYVANGALLHNCPEASLGKLKSSGVIRTLAGEGRKFGIGLCVISQRPAKIDKNVVSQCSTQILLKITNPNDLKSVIASSEGVDSSSEQEIQRLNIGTCLLTGVIDIPLKVNVRPRLSKHGGETVDVTLSYEEKTGGDNNNSSENNETDNQVPEVKEEKKQTQPHMEFIEHVKAEMSFDDAKVLIGENIKTDLIPGVMAKIKLQSGDEIQVLIELLQGNIVKSIVPYNGIPLPFELTNLSQTEKTVLAQIMDSKNEFTAAELLLNSKLMYTEIMRTCESLASKKLITKKGDKYSKENLNAFSNPQNIQFVGQQQFEEIEYTTRHEAKITLQNVVKTLEMFGTITSTKPIEIVYYVEN